MHDTHPKKLTYNLMFSLGLTCWSRSSSKSSWVRAPSSSCPSPVGPSPFPSSAALFLLSVTVRRFAMAATKVSYLNLSSLRSASASSRVSTTLGGTGGSIPSCRRSSFTWWNRRCSHQKRKKKHHVIQELADVTNACMYITTGMHTIVHRIWQSVV